MKKKSKESRRISRLPPYLFARINRLKMEAWWQGRDVIDLGMGNPDRPAPKHVIDKLVATAQDRKAHRYSASRGIPHLRRAICEWYEKRFGVRVDPETEAAVVIGSKEGLCHLSLALLNEGDQALVPNPTYPIHLYGVAIAGGRVRSMPLVASNDFLPDFGRIRRQTAEAAKMMILSYPHNPTTQVATLDFFREAVRFARKCDIIVIHDLAYSEICFDGTVAPSFLHHHAQMQYYR